MISGDNCQGREVQVKRLKVEKRALTVTHDLFVFTFVSLIYCYYSEELIAKRRNVNCGLWFIEGHNWCEIVTAQRYWTVYAEVVF